MYIYTSTQEKLLNHATARVVMYTKQMRVRVQTHAKELTSIEYSNL